jgi:chaperonin GroEL (HSP60 family)
MQVSIILRGANDFMLDEVERSLHDALCIVKRTLESNMVENLFLLFVYLLCCLFNANIFPLL